MAAYGDERDRARRPGSSRPRGSCASSPRRQFVELQEQLSSLLDEEAIRLAEQPSPRRARRTAAGGRRALIHETTTRHERRDYLVMDHHQLPPQRRRQHRDACTLDAVRAAPRRPSSSSGPLESGCPEPTAGAACTASSALARSAATRRRSATTSTTPRLMGSDMAPTARRATSCTCLAGCLRRAWPSIAAARGVELTEVTSTVEGDIDLERHPRPRPRGPQRLRADPGVVRGERVTARPRERTRTVEGAAPPSSTSSPTPCRSR